MSDMEIKRAYSAEEVEEAFRRTWNASTSKTCLWDELNKEDRAYWRARMPFRGIVASLNERGDHGHDGA